MLSTFSSYIFSRALRNSCASVVALVERLAGGCTGTERGRWSRPATEFGARRGTSPVVDVAVAAKLGLALAAAESLSPTASTITTSAMLPLSLPLSLPCGVDCADDDATSVFLECSSAMVTLTNVGQAALDKRPISECNNNNSDDGILHCQFFFAGLAQFTRFFLDGERFSFDFATVQWADLTKSEHTNGRAENRNQPASQQTNNQPVDTNPTLTRPPTMRRENCIIHQSCRQASSNITITDLHHQAWCSLRAVCVCVRVWLCALENVWRLKKPVTPRLGDPQVKQVHVSSDIVCQCENNNHTCRCSN